MAEIKTYSVDIQTCAKNDVETSILIIYTGGTFGMVFNEESGNFEPFHFENVLQQIPELYHFNYKLKVVSFEEPIDSSDMSPKHWIKLAEIIDQNYTKHDGFVVLHGTDTMAYSASALSFLLENLDKPVIFTGAQIPIGESRTDAKDNLLSALEIAAVKRYGKTVVPEVCIYFDKILLRGNRSKKFESSHFDAFKSENYPKLAKAGINLDFRFDLIRKSENKDLVAQNKMCENVVILKLFPGITEAYVKGICELPNLQGLVIETFGSGNAPSNDWFREILLELKRKDVVVVNISQCDEGTIIQDRYATSRVFSRTGVIGGEDITLEAAITKLMYLLGNYDIEITRQKIAKNIRGEISE